MKKTLLFLIGLFAISWVSAQDTIAGWTFPTSIKTPSYGLAINSARFIGTEVDSLRPITFTTGQTTGDTAATTIGWHNGVGTKYWIVKFKTTGYTDIKISSKQRAGNQNGGGPKDFLIQWKVGSTMAWTNIINDTIHCANDWTTGVVTNAAFPSTADTSANNISVRWVLASNLNTSNTAIDSLGISKIDDIIVTGTSISSGVEEVLFSSNVNIYPNPSTGLFTVQSAETIENIEVMNIAGALVLEQKPASKQAQINMQQFESGIYFVKMTFSEGTQSTRKIIVR